MSAFAAILRIVAVPVTASVELRLIVVPVIACMVEVPEGVRVLHPIAPAVKAPTVVVPSVVLPVTVSPVIDTAAPVSVPATVKVPVNDRVGESWVPLIDPF